MLKKILSLVFAVLVCVSAYHYASSESLFTEPCAALVKARQLLEEKYGLNQSLAAYFTEAVLKEEDGYKVVFYSTFEDLDYVLGRYTATIKGEDASISWSWDGKEVPYAGNGLASHAWGKDQLREIWLINKQSSRMSEYATIARDIAYAGGYDHAGYIAPLPGNGEEPDTQDYDPAKAKITIEDSKKIALDAIKEAYGLSNEQLNSMRLGIDGDFTWYEGNSKGEPVTTIVYVLWDEHKWEDGNGNYYVTVNQANGLVEELYYLDGIIGNG